MYRLKHIILSLASLLLFFFEGQAQHGLINQQKAQIYSQHNVQRTRIDSLRKVLLTAGDTLRIDCLNNLSPEYYIFNTDTSWLYAQQAYTSASAINYIKGMAESLHNLGQITQERGDIQGAEYYFSQVPDLYKKIKALKEYNKAVRTLGYNLFLQLRFDEARDLFIKILPYYQNLRDKEDLAYTCRVVGKTYQEQGYYEKAFEYFQKDMEITRTLSENGTRRSLFMWGNYFMARLYQHAGDKNAALNYYRLSAQRAKENQLPDCYNSRLGDIALLLHNYDSARYFYRLSHYLIAIRVTDPDIRKTALVEVELNIGETYLAQGKYDEALEFFKTLASFSRPVHFSTMRVLYNIAHTYKGRRNTDTSLLFSKQLLDIAQMTGARQYIRDAYELYWNLYDQLGKKDSAYKYSLLYNSMKDSLARDIQLRNIGIIEMKAKEEQQDAKIALLSKGKKIREQQNQILFICLGGLILLGIVVFRNISLKRRNELTKRKHLQSQLVIQNLEAEQTKALLKQQAAELEMQALRTQMNPHFIFNSLNSINRFILQNDKAQASQYLTKFSKLVRMILQNSQAAMITLENELETLQLYIDLEALRFENHFSYNISIPEHMDIDVLKIPPLVIQPYVENAIWHGLMHKEEKGQLNIEISQDSYSLLIKISDDGIGRIQAAALNRKDQRHKSMGLRITSARLAMHNKISEGESPVIINDLVHPDGSPAGTEVLIKLPVLT